MSDKSSLENKLMHLDDEEFRKAVYYHPFYPEDGINYEKIFMHIGRCNQCKRHVEEERSRNPTYKLYLKAIENNNVEEFWEAVRKAAKL